MPRRSSVDIPSGAHSCPHCQGKMALWLGKGGFVQGLRCRRCRCRWSHFGWLVKWGTQCPLLVRTGPARS